MLIAYSHNYYGIVLYYYYFTNMSYFVAIAIVGHYDQIGIAGISLPLRYAFCSYPQ